MSWMAPHNQKYPYWWAKRDQHYYGLEQLEPVTEPCGQLGLETWDTVKTYLQPSVIPTHNDDIWP